MTFAEFLIENMTDVGASLQSDNEVGISQSHNVNAEEHGTRFKHAKTITRLKVNCVGFVYMHIYITIIPTIKCLTLFWILSFGVRVHNFVPCQVWTR